MRILFHIPWKTKEQCSYWLWISNRCSKDGDLRSTRHLLFYDSIQQLQGSCGYSRQCRLQVSFVLLSVWSVKKHWFNCHSSHLDFASATKKNTQMLLEKLTTGQQWISGQPVSHHGTFAAEELQADSACSSLADFIIVVNILWKVKKTIFISLWKLVNIHNMASAHIPMTHNFKA